MTVEIMVNLESTLTILEVDVLVINTYDLMVLEKKIRKQGLIKQRIYTEGADQWHRPKITHAKILVYLAPQRVTPLKSMITQLKTENTVEILDLSRRV